MKRIIFLFLLILNQAIGSPDRNIDSQTSRSWHIIIRLLSSLSFLFPYSNAQPLIINEDPDDRVPHNTSRIFYSGTEPQKNNPRL